jgi:hypothetical protein
MSFRTALWVMLALLVLPLGGILFTVFSGSKPHRASDRGSRTAKAESVDSPRHKRKREAEPEPEPEPEPLRALETAPTFVTISGTHASSRSGLSGGLWWKADEGGSNISNPCGNSTCLSEKGAKLCAKGKAQGLGKKPRNLWGAALGWNLHEDNAGVHPLGKTKVKGLSFVFDPDGSEAEAEKPSTPPSPTEAAAKDSKLAQPSHDPAKKSENKDGYRFALHVGDTDYCATVEAGKNRILFKDLRKSCDGKRRGPRLSEALIPEGKHVKWEAPSPNKGRLKFNFCISELKTL